MLAPVENEHRRSMHLDGIWDFVLDPDDRGATEEWFRAFPGASIPMPVPASYNDVTVDAAVRDHVGAVWYRRRFFVPSDWRDHAVVVRVGAASHRARAWVNGRLVAEHKGGFLPFEGVLDAALRFGGDNELVIRVDNRLDWSTLPPGELVPAGRKRPGYDGARVRQEYFHDFFNYAGIHRSVRVQRLPRSRIDDIAVRTDYAAGAGRVDYEVMQIGTGEVSVELRDANGNPVASGSGARGTLTLSEAIPWRPGRAYLYTLVVALRGDDGPLDEYRLKVGLRRVEVGTDAFTINGEPFYFRGFGKHEDTTLRGKGHDDVTLVRDLSLLRWIGANSFRTSHYPYAEEILDLADREGVAVIGEVPAVGMNSWNKGEPWFVDGKLDSATLDHHLACIREMVARDRNHPCIVMWSVANEASTWEPASRAYFERCVAEFRALDDRPLTMAQSSNPDECRVQDLLDVLTLNRYYGWYENTADLSPEVLQQCLAHEIETWRRRFPNQPLLMGEFGADALAGLHQLPSNMFSEEFQAELVELTLDELARHDFVIGEHLWAFADFMTKQGLTRVGGNKKGVFTRDRQPKLVAHVLRQRWSRE